MFKSFKKKEKPKMKNLKTEIKLPVDIGVNTQLLSRSVSDHMIYFFKNIKTGLSCWLVSKKLTKKELVRSLITIESGYSRGLTLKGVGYKANVQDGILELKVGKPNTTDFVIPNNLFLWVKGTKINGWSVDPSVMNNFYHKVIKLTPAKKGSLILDEKKY